MNTTPQHKERKHSLLAPSKADIWTVCTAQPLLVESNEDRIVEQSSVYADEGTAAHEIADALMRGTRIPRNDRWTKRQHEDMVMHANGYRRYITEVCGGSYDPAGVELEVPLFYRRDDNGHVDFCQILPDKVVVVDYKYGAGKKVIAKGNRQMSIYAMSAILELDILGLVKDTTPIHLAIYQPRCREEGESAASEWIIPFGELSHFCERDIAAPAVLIQNRTKHLLKFVPGDNTCHWCPCQSFCEARNEHLVTGVPLVRYMTKPDSITPTPPDRITDDNFASILAHAPQVRKWLDSCEEYALNRALNGNPVPGTKVVAGRGSRSWVDEAKAERAMKKAGIAPHKPTPVISPFQAEEAGFDKKMVEKLAKRTPGKPVLAMADDPRPEFQLVLASDEFQTVRNPDLESLL